MRRPSAIAIVMAAFLLLQEPFALPAMAALAGNVSPCAGMSLDHADGCACCPDGVASMAACMSLCAAAACIAPSLPRAYRPLSIAADLFAPQPLASRTDPPPDPPPIA